MNDAYSVASVAAASCSDHVEVLLRSEGGDTRRFKTDVSTGQAILAELHHVPSDRGTWIDLISATVDALGSCIAYVELAAGEPAGGWLVLDSDAKRLGIGRLPVGMALLVAVRLSLPVRIREHQPSTAALPELPATIQAFLDELALD